MHVWLKRVSTRGALLSSELQLGVEQHLLGAGLCETDGQLSPITAQLYATASLWANHNGPEEANGNEASLLLANQERGVAESNSSGGKLFLRWKNVHTLASSKLRNQSDVTGSNVLQFKILT